MVLYFLLSNMSVPMNAHITVAFRIYTHIRNRIVLSRPSYTRILKVVYINIYEAWQSYNHKHKDIMIFRSCRKHVCRFFFLIIIAFNDRLTSRSRTHL